jgi:hypothetical protein
MRHTFGKIVGLDLDPRAAAIVRELDILLRAVDVTL